MESKLNCACEKSVCVNEEKKLCMWGDKALKEDGGVDGVC